MKGEAVTPNSPVGVRRPRCMIRGPYRHSDQLGWENVINSVLSGSIRRPFRWSQTVTSSNPWATASAAAQNVGPDAMMAPSSTYIYRDLFDQRVRMR